MRGVLPSAKCPRVRTVLVTGVLAALCFSVGEGLRLLPPPYAPPGPGGRADSRAEVSNTDRTRQNQFKPGSLGLPPQAQKNLQHKQTHCAPAAGCAPPPPHYAPPRSGAWRGARRDLSASVPGPAGRAPPLAA
jgi:hypothetical protein